MKFKVLTVASLKTTAFWDTALCSLIEVYLCFTTLMKGAVSTSEMSVYFNKATWRYIHSSPWWQRQYAPLEMSVNFNMTTWCHIPED
jgi:hypothetical protein